MLLKNLKNRMNQTTQNIKIYLIKMGRELTMIFERREGGQPKLL